jgi:hypothetical protein
MLTCFMKKLSLSHYILHSLLQQAAILRGYIGEVL